MLNATYLQYWRAGDLNEDPRNRRVLAEAFSSERGAILVGADRRVAESEPTDDRYDFQRIYPQPFKYAHLTGWFSYFSQTGLEQSQNAVLSGDDSRLFVTRLVDLFSNSSAKGGSVQLTIDPRGADGGLRRARRPRRGRRGRRWWRSSRAAAGSWRWCRCRRTTPTSSPATTSARSPSELEELQEQRRRAAAQPRDPDPARPRLDLQAGDRRGGDRVAATTTPTRRCPAARPTSCRRPAARAA